MDFVAPPWSLLEASTDTFTAEPYEFVARLVVASHGVFIKDLVFVLLLRKCREAAKETRLTSTKHVRALLSGYAPLLRCTLETGKICMDP